MGEFWVSFSHQWFSRLCIRPLWFAALHSIIYFGFDLCRWCCFSDTQVFLISPIKGRYCSPKLFPYVEEPFFPLLGFQLTGTDKPQQKALLFLSKCFRKKSKIEVGAVESCCNLLVWKDSRLTPLTDFSVVPDGTVCFLVHMTQQNENDLNCFWKLSGNFLYWIFNIITLTGFFLILKLSGKDLPIKLNKIIIQVSCLMSHNKNFFFFCKSHLVNCTDYCT